MRKRNTSVLTIIFFTIIMAISSILIARYIKITVMEYAHIGTGTISVYYVGFILMISITALIIITQAIRLIEHKPDMYKYDTPLAMMNECSEQIQLQQKKNELYAAIVQTLSDEYEIVYFVDTETEEYLKYVRTDEHSILWLDKHRHYFFTEIYRYLVRIADKNDIQELSKEITKSNILSVLNEKNTFSAKFRSFKGGVTHYYVVKALHFMNEESKHIVLGIRNINSWIQSENEYKEAVGQAIEMAVIDDLTGVKNRNAYVKHEHEIETLIQNDTDTRVAIVVLDVNGLKHVNDTMGHKAGDTLLKDASALIREVFADNDIYRIGGDEFAVILFGNSYDERNSLLDKFRARVMDNMNSDKVVIASGMAEYMPDIDTNAESIFDRADAAMYKNKVELKNNRRG